MELGGINITEMALTLGEVSIACYKLMMPSKARKIKAKRVRPFESLTALFCQAAHANTGSLASIFKIGSTRLGVEWQGKIAMKHSMSNFFVWLPGKARSCSRLIS